MDMQTQPDPCRIALFGEFSSGKSTLINALLGRRLLPAQVTATHLPAIWISRGRKPWSVVGVDGTSRPVVPADLGKVAVAGTAHVRAYVEAPILEHFDLIDTPGNADPNISSEHWRQICGQADAAIWCTAATNAWRQSELAAWKDVPQAVRANGILAVTRADKLEDETDAARLFRRVTRDAGRHFRAIHLIAATEGFGIVELRDELIAIARELRPPAVAPAAGPARRVLPFRAGGARRNTNLEDVG